MAKNTFSLDVSNFINEFENGAEKTMRTIAGKAFSSIILSSPADTGRFRANWFASGGSPSSKTTESKDKSGTSTTKNAAVIVSNLKNWSSFTLSNNLPYANHLEYGLYGDGTKTVGGYSKQAPSGFVRVNIARMQNLLETEAKKNLPK